MKYMDKMMKIIPQKSSLMEVISFKAIPFIGGEKQKQNKKPPESLINFHHLSIQNTPFIY